MCFPRTIFKQRIYKQDNVLHMYYFSRCHKLLSLHEIKRFENMIF